MLKRFSLFLISMAGMVGCAQLWTLASGAQVQPGCMHLVGFADQNLGFQKHVNSTTAPFIATLLLPVGPYGEVKPVQAQVKVAIWDFAQPMVVNPM